MSDQAKTRQAVSAAVIGNVLEWYDFAVYAFVAAIIARKFFPQTDEITALLSAFLAYGLGFVARPLGGIVIGRLGDTQGRKAALLLTIFLMAVCTVIIGLIPTYLSIGVLAPALLVAARLMQGFSAGGEWGGCGCGAEPANGGRAALKTGRRCASDCHWRRQWPG